MRSKNQARLPAADFASTWERFKASRRRELDNWFTAERAIAAGRQGGAADDISGERLLAAEAALQSAIVDFAASQEGVSDPGPVALELLRMAESILAARVETDEYLSDRS